MLKFFYFVRIRLGSFTQVFHLHCTYKSTLSCVALAEHCVAAAKSCVTAAEGCVAIAIPK